MISCVLHQGLSAIDVGIDLGLTPSVDSLAMFIICLLMRLGADRKFVMLFSEYLHEVILVVVYRADQFLRAGSGWYG